MAKTFVDTNVLVYAHDADAGTKHDLAESLLAALWDTGEGVLSTQVLQEFYVTTTGKLRTPLEPRAAREIISDFSSWQVHLIEPEDVLAAARLHSDRKLSFWDALIVISASQAGASMLASEDMQHGATLAGVEIRNPFLG